MTPSARIRSAPSRLRSFSVPGSVAVVVLALATVPASAKTIDLRAALESQNGEAANRALSFEQDGGRTVAHLDARSGDGGALVKDMSLRTGVIEVDIQGRNAPGQSFVGIAFGSTGPGVHEAVYFRPFNFASDDPARRAHAVQYIAMPDYGWERLRKERPQEFESAVTPEPKPDEWFHARIEIGEEQVRVFVNGSDTPTLTIRRLAKAADGRVGLWVGNGSEGRFANLEVTPGG